METLPSLLRLPETVRSGPGTAATLLPGCRAFGDRGLLVHGASLRRSGRLQAVLRTAPADASVLAWEHPGGEPRLDQLQGLLEVARQQNVHWVAGLGGGSVLDMAKACAGLIRAFDDGMSLREVHTGAPVDVEGVPFAAAPATAGTGAEATPNAVLTDRSSGAKRSIRAPSMFARLVVLDPQLMAGTPRAVVAAAGMDALTQAVEAFASTGSTRLTRALSREAFLLVQEHLETVHRSGGQDPDAAYGLLQGSFLAGVALAHARLGVVHGLAHPLGAQLHLPHGLVCAFCLGPALRLNRQAMAADYQDLSRAAGRDLQELVQDLLQRLGLENPFAGKTLPDREAAVQETLDSGSTAHNPRPVSRQDVERLLDEILAPAP